MARRVPLPLVALGLLLPLAAAAQEPVFSTLAGYTFDRGTPPTGPDTFRVWERARGRVTRTPTLRWSGEYSIEIRDSAGDGDFPELQGYFERRDSGRLFVHFAFLVVDPSQTFNVALAGPAWFRLAKDGIAFWLTTREGFLVHISDGIPKKLAILEPFAWYLVDLLYDVDAGRYDLALYKEGLEEPLVSLIDQPNPVAQPGSVVDKFSFIGDRGEDTSNVVYYVDDIFLAAGEKLEVPPFIAPGRRRLFVEMFGAHRQLAARQFLCLPVLSVADLGIRGRGPGPKQVDLAVLRTALAPGPVAPTADAEGEVLAPLLDGIYKWRSGCAALAAGRAEEALGAFVSASEAVPEGRLFRLSQVLALARLQRWPEVEKVLGESRVEWRSDPRFATLVSMERAARGELEEALAWMRPLERRLQTGATMPASDEEDGARLVEAAVAEALMDSMVADQLFYLLVSAERLEKALTLAVELAHHPALSKAEWLERAGDAALLAKNPEDALGFYRQAEELSEPGASFLLKLADVHYLLGDLSRERELREAVYGSLE